MATSTVVGGRAGRRSQKEAEDYLSRIKLREIFQVSLLNVSWQTVRTYVLKNVQGMLTHVVVHQPEDPIAYFHEELSRIKKEVEENNVSIIWKIRVFLM